MQKKRNYVAKLSERTKKLKAGTSTSTSASQIHGTPTPSENKGELVWSRTDSGDIIATRTEPKVTPLFEGAANEELYHAMVKLRSTLGNGTASVLDDAAVEVEVVNSNPGTVNIKMSEMGSAVIPGFC